MERLPTAECCFYPAMVASGMPYPVEKREKRRMTMQVALTGSDGILLASDTHKSHEPEKIPPDQIGHVVRSSTNGPKIRVYPDSGVAISCADDVEAAEAVADAIVLALRKDQPSDVSRIEELIESVTDRHFSKNKTRIQCLIVLTRPCLLLFRLQYPQGPPTEYEWVARCSYSESRSVAGDATNPALFWAERYHEDFYSMDDLVPLAAHLIQSAHRLHSAGVSKLQMVKCSENRIEIVPTETCKAWTRRSEEWDRSFRETIFGGDSPSRTAD